MMTSLFKNNYKVYLYKYNYSALQKSISDLIADNSANRFLFESFVTDLYTIGVPSDVVAEEIKKKYTDYVNDYINQKSKLSTSDRNISKQIGESKTLEYKQLGEDTDRLLKYNRATISSEDDLVQRALAQNYALQMLQRDYEDDKMTVGSDKIKINWLNTMEKKKTYDNYIKKALNLSTNLLNKLFNPVIEDIKAIQAGDKTSSQYVHVIDLTNLGEFGVIDEVLTERTKYTNDNFISLNTKRGDITNDNKDNSLDSIGVITTTLEGLSNMTNFNLRQDVLLKHNINIEANDIIEIVNINQNKTLSKSLSTQQINETNRNTQFIGFVTKVNLSQRFGGVSLLNVSCEGISKVLSLNPTISNNAVAPQFSSVVDFIAGKDEAQKTASAAVTNVFSSFFDGLNAFDLFTKLLSDVLAVSPVEEDKTSYVLRLISDPEKLKQLPYQYAKPLIVLYHLAVTISTIREVGKKTHIVLAQVENNVNQEKLQAYLLMIRSQFDLFWSTMTTPISILQTLANNTFLEIFEDRNGILILRPPRYNVWIDDDVIEEDNFIEWNQSIDDSTLKSRSDYQWSIPAIGVQNEFCGGYYQDIPALLKYGFRIDSPKNSPSVQSEIDAAVYSALDVTKANSNTRTFELTVPLTQDYVLGRLYYFPINKSIYGNVKSTGFVGYLSTIATTIAPGHVDTHRLTFKYMRTAELLDTNDVNLAKQSGAHILNFKRLPELSMYQSSVTPDMITPRQRDQLNTKVNKLCANSRYYWASFDDPNKKNFDEWSKINRYVTPSKQESLWKTMAPTNIKVKDFKSYDTIKSSVFTPTQQLINAIWFTDLLMRTNHKGDSLFKGNSREIRTKDNEKNFIKFLRQDATFGSKYNSVKYIEGLSFSDSLSAPYATVNDKFFIYDSLYPNLLSGFQSEAKKELETIMSNFARIYEKYINDTGRNSEYEVWYNDWLNKYKTYNVSFETHCNRLKSVYETYAVFINNAFKFHEFEVAYNNAGSDVALLYEYVDIKEPNALEYTVRLAMKSADVSSGMFHFSFIEKLVDFISKIFKEITSQVGIPAYIYEDSNQFPLVQPLYKRGAYIAGVSPIDYKKDIDNFNSDIIQNNLGNNNQVTLKDMSFRNAKGDVIGTFKKLILDPKIYRKTGLLYYYPVIEFDANKVQLYGVDITKLNATYITTEQEITDFIEDGFVKVNDSLKLLPCVIRVGCTQIPEAKIPTIQQIYNQGGLYVGVNETNEGLKVNDAKAIFDPAVLYNWSNSDFENLYNVTIYNLIESLNGNQCGSYLFCDKRLDTGLTSELNLQVNGKFTWANYIEHKDKNNTRAINILNWAPCVYNSELSFNLSNEYTIDTTTQSNIVDRFKECMTGNKSTFKIDTFKNSKLYIQDLNESETQYALLLGFDRFANLSNTEYIVTNDKTASYSKNITYTAAKTAFIKSIESKEQTQVALYNSDYSYMQLVSKDLYPNKINETLGDSNGN